MFQNKPKEIRDLSTAHNAFLKHLSTHARWYTKDSMRIEYIQFLQKQQTKIQKLKKQRISRSILKRLLFYRLFATTVK